MAERRMFSKSITNSDSFLEMPLSSQCLYFHLSMNADDDGFVDRTKSIIRMVGAKDDDLKVLISKSFIIPFETGIIVIKHWKINNYLRNDRHKSTNYTFEKDQLFEKENGSYTLGIPSGRQSVYQVETQYSIGKDSIDKDSIGKVNIEEGIKEETTLPSPPPSKHKYGNYGTVLLTTSQYDKLISDYGDKNYIDNVINRVDELCKMTGNKYKWKDFNLVIRKVIRENWSIVKDLKIERNDCGEVF